MAKNIVRAEVITEANDISKGEYSVFIAQFVGFLGEDDYALVKEAIDERLADLTLPFEGVTVVDLIETGEWEGGHWHKYYQITDHIQTVVHQETADSGQEQGND